MKENQTNEAVNYKTYNIPRYMMATTAFHKCGNISRNKPDICFVYGYSYHEYIGRWVTCSCLIDVLFPRKTTHQLTRDEIRAFNKKWYSMERQLPHQLNIKLTRQPMRSKNE